MNMKSIEMIESGDQWDYCLFHFLLIHQTVVNKLLTELRLLLRHDVTVTDRRCVTRPSV